MTAKDDRKNAEGYNDPTAYNAIKNVEQEQDKDDVRFHQLLNMLFSLCELADFHIEGRVVLKDKRTGKVWEVGEMKICKVRPDYSTCSACIATQEMFNVVDDCSRCKLNIDTYELLQIGTGFWSGDYAMVQKDGKITKVSLNRVYDVKESL